MDERVYFRRGSELPVHFGLGPARVRYCRGLSGQTVRDTMGTDRTKGRVIFLIRLKPGAQAQFLEAYESIRHEVARGVKGHIVDQVCQSPDDPDSWMITSEWESLDDFLAWERTEEHRELARPLRECFAEARSLKYVVREETRH